MALSKRKKRQALSISSLTAKKNKNTMWQHSASLGNFDDRHRKPRFGQAPPGDLAQRSTGSPMAPSNYISLRQLSIFVPSSHPCYSSGKIALSQGIHNPSLKQIETDSCSLSRNQKNTSQYQPFCHHARSFRDHLAFYASESLRRFCSQPRKRYVSK